MLSGCRGDSLEMDALRKGSEPSWVWTWQLKPLLALPEWRQEGVSRGQDVRKGIRAERTWLVWSEC